MARKSNLIAMGGNTALNPVPENRTYPNDTIILNSINMNGLRFANVPTSEMIPDPTYQRNTGMAAHIAKNWNHNLVGVIISSYRDGKFFIVDGHNRVVAAMMIGETHLPCQIYTGLTEKDEANIFAEQDNLRTRLTTYDKVKAKIIGENSLVLNLRAICEEYGIAIQRVAPNSTGTLTALSRTMKTYETYGEESIRFIFDIISESNWHNAPLGYGDAIVSALTNIYLHHRDELDKVSGLLIAQFSKTSPRSIISTASAMFVDRGRQLALTAYLEELLKR